MENKTAVSGQKRPRGRPRSQASEDAILEATLELLAQGGYGAVTVDKVAAIANASKATIYRRWRSKENLVIAAFERTPLLDIPKKGKVTERLIELVWQFTKFSQATALGKVLPALAAERLHNPELDHALGPLISSRRQPMIDAINEGIASGEFIAGTDPEFVADMCWGPPQLRSVVMHLPVTKKYIRHVVEAACASLQTKG
jgi:AcrR family transcriptional regulator